MIPNNLRLVTELKSTEPLTVSFEDINLTACCSCMLHVTGVPFELDPPLGPSFTVVILPNGRHQPKDTNPTRRFIKLGEL